MLLKQPVAATWARACFGVRAYAAPPASLRVVARGSLVLLEKSERLTMWASFQMRSDEVLGRDTPFTLRVNGVQDLNLIVSMYSAPAVGPKVKNTRRGVGAEGTLCKDVLRTGSRVKNQKPNE